MTNPNDMSAWAAITCQRGHTGHESQLVTIDLAEPHGYTDCTPIPPALVPAPFVMHIWPPEQYPVDGGPYCPAHDAVSETIVSHRVWEPRESVLTLGVCKAGGLVVDVGAQLGWYSLLALASGCQVHAVEADQANLTLLEASAADNGWADDLTAELVRIDAATPAMEPTRIRLAKVDLEGADAEAVRVLWPSIASGFVDHMMIECSPVFVPGEHYPELVASIVAEGYRAYLLPAKQSPPITITAPERDLVRIDDDPELRARVAGWHQEDVWFRREGASW